MAYSPTRDSRLAFRKLPAGEAKELVQTKPSEHELMAELYPTGSTFTNVAYIPRKRRMTCAPGSEDVALPFKRGSAQPHDVRIKSENSIRESSPTSTHLTVRVRKLESQNATLTSEKAALISRNESLISENATLITQNTEKDALISRNESLVSENATLITQNVEKDANIAARKAAHAILSRENSNLAKDKVKIHGKLKVMTESHNHRVSEMDDLIGKEAGLLARIAELEEDSLRSDTWRAEITQRESEALKKTEQEKADWQQEKQTLSNGKNQWMEQYADLKLNNESLRQENDGLRRDNAELNTRDQHLGDKIAELQPRIAELQPLIEDLGRGRNDRGGSRFRDVRDERSRSPFSGGVKPPTGPRAERRGR